MGDTRPELGGSEFYELLGYVGLSVPKVNPEAFLPYYRLLSQAGQRELLASAHGLYRGGLAVHLALSSLAAGLGLEVDLSRVAPDLPDYAALYSESAGRFLVSVDPADATRLEELFAGQPLALIGQVQSGPNLQDHPARPDAVGGSPGQPEDGLGAPFRRTGLRPGDFSDIIITSQARQRRQAGELQHC